MIGYQVMINVKERWRGWSSEVVELGELKFEHRLCRTPQFCLRLIVEPVVAEVEGGQSGVLTFKALAITIPPFFANRHIPKC